MSWHDGPTGRPTSASNSAAPELIRDDAPCEAGAGGDGGGGPQPSMFAVPAAPQQRPHPGGSLSSFVPASPEPEDAAAGPPARLDATPPPTSEQPQARARRGAPDEAAGGGGRAAPAGRAPVPSHRQVHQLPTTSTPLPASPVPGTSNSPSRLPAALDAAVKRALELATAREFSDAEACLAQISIACPEYTEAREVIAAREAVAMCKQFYLRA